MTERIREFLRSARATTAPASSSISTSCATTTRPLPRRCRTRRVFYAVKANPAPEVLCAAGLARLLLRHRLGRRDRDGARGRRQRLTASPTATRSRRSATSRAPSRSACACSRSTAWPRSRRSPAPRPARKVFCRILFDCVGRRMAAVAQVRLRAGDGGRRARARPPARARGLRRVVPRRLAAAQPAGLGPGARRRRPRSSAPARERGINALHGQSRRRLPDQVPEERAGGEDLRPRRSSARCASISATASRRRSSSRAAAWSAMPA